MVTRTAASVVVSLLSVLCASTPALTSPQRPLADGIEDLARQITANVAKDQRQKIAVLPFGELQGRPMVLGLYLAEELTTRFYQIGNLDVFERTQLDKIMGELKLASTAVIDAETAKQIGQLAGVDAIVIGTITDFPSSAAVNCRIIDVRTGKILGAARTDFAKDEKLKAIMGSAESATGPSGAAKSPDAAKPPGAPPPASPSVPARPRVVEEQFAFELQGCESSLEAVRCTLLATNLAGQTRKLLVITNYRGLPPTRALGTSGEYIATLAEIMGERSARVNAIGRSDLGRVQADLAHDAPTRLVLSFDRASTSESQFRLLEISASTYYSSSPRTTAAPALQIRTAGRGGGQTVNFRITFRDVPIAKK